MNSKILEGKVAIINGASSTIGKEIAKGLLDERALICGTYNKNKGPIDELISNYDEDRILSFSIDFLLPEYKEKIRNAIKRTRDHFGKIDILANLSGIWYVEPFLHEKEEETDKLWKVNYWAPYYFMKKTIPYMLQNHGEKVRGRIVNIASVVGERGSGQQITYGATRAALINLTKGLAEEMAPFKILINACSPGYVDTPTLNKYLDEPLKDILIKHTPIGRLAKPEDVAERCLSMLKSNYLTRQNEILDGGSS